MRASRAIVAVAATGLVGVLAIGAAVPASAAAVDTGSLGLTAAAVDTGSPDLTAAGTALSPKAPTPFPGKKPAAVLALASKALKAAKSFHVKGTIAGADSTLTIDMIVSKAAGRGVWSDTKLGTVQVVRLKSVLYMKADWHWWAASGNSEEATKDLVDQWLQVRPGSQTFTFLNGLTTPDPWRQVVGEFRPARRVPGRPVLKLPTVGLQGGDVTLYVAAKGAPYPLLLIQDAASARTTIALSEWNKTVVVRAPDYVGSISFTKKSV